MMQAITRVTARAAVLTNTARSLSSASMTQQQRIDNNWSWPGIAVAGTALCGMAIVGARIASAEQPAQFTLPPLPYALDALEPHMSKQTLEFHWGKHHRAYVDNLNKQVAGTILAGKSLEDVIKATWGVGTPHPAFNNAAQVWNHTFFWESMKPNGGGLPGGKLAAAIQRDFGSLDKLKAELKEAGLTQFGSGWAWLVCDVRGKLSVIKTPNAVCPLTMPGVTALLTIDVWEHAYYLDVQNRRSDYITVFLDKLVNWDAVEARYKKVVG